MSSVDCYINDNLTSKSFHAKVKLCEIIIIFLIAF